AVCTLLVIMVLRAPRPALLPYAALFRSSRPSASGRRSRPPAAVVRAAAPAASGCSKSARSLRRRVCTAATSAAVTSAGAGSPAGPEEHTSELQSREKTVGRLALANRKGR